MRKWFASLAVLGFASAVATAQTIPMPPVGGCGQTQQMGYDDGTSETSWKVSWPTTAGDAFSVDFNAEAANIASIGVGMNLWESSTSAPHGLKYVGLFPDNLVVDSTGHTPDLNNPYSILGNLSGTATITGTPGVGAGYCPGFIGYDTPDVVLPSVLGGGVHAAMSFLTGDSNTWLCSDQSSNAGHSYFSVNNYSTAALGLSGNLMLRVLGGVSPPPGGSASFTVNNSAGLVSVKQAGTIATTLWSTCAIQPTAYLQGALITGYPFIAAPQIVMFTGFENFTTISDQFQGTVCGPLSDPTQGPCVPAGLNFALGAFYADNCDLKKNGNPKIKATNFVLVTVTPDPGACNPCVCFGQKDDGSLDGTIWKVQNPAGSKDYFNVHVGTFADPTGGNCGTQFTSVQMASWDFCGSGPSWGSVGIYTSNTAIDTTGGTPDVSVGGTVASATTLSMPAGAAEWDYSTATTYDFPDVTLSSAFSGDLHIAAQWASQDSCTWIASDTDATDDNAGNDCAQFPSTNSYFTLDGYTTAAIPFGNVNWIMKINWN